MTEKYYKKSTRQYLVKTTIRVDVPIEEDELEKTLNAWQLKGKEIILLKLKQGVIENTYIGAITDYEDKVVVETLDPGTMERSCEIKPLKDLFSDVKYLDNKQIRKIG